MKLNDLEFLETDATYVLKIQANGKMLWPDTSPTTEFINTEIPMISIEQANKLLKERLKQYEIR